MSITRAGACLHFRKTPLAAGLRATGREKIKMGQETREETGVETLGCVLRVGVELEQG